MRIDEIPNEEIRAEAQQFIQNVNTLVSKLTADWSRDNIRWAAGIFKVAADEFSILADHPDPFPGE